MPEDLLSIGTNAGLTFDRVNVIDFWLVGLASVVTEATPEDKYVGWIRDDPDNAIYTRLRTAALMLILKYSMLSMGMPQGEVYELSIAMLMRSVLTFDISEGSGESWKLALVCRKARTPLVMEEYKAYASSATEPKIPVTDKETAIDTSSPRLAPGVRASDTFNSALVDPPESQFVSSNGLSDADHTRRHAQAVIALNKEFEFSPGPHRLDSLAPPVLAATEIDEIAQRYSRLPLERADDFHRTRIEYEIARLDIITAEAANRALALKATLQQIEKRKAKRMEQLKTIEAIKTSNLAMEEKIKAEERELHTGGAGQSGNKKESTATPRQVRLGAPIGDQTENTDADEGEALMEATLLG